MSASSLIVSAGGGSCVLAVVACGEPLGRLRTLSFALEAFLGERDRNRLTEAARSVGVVSVQALCEEWFRYKRPYLAPATVQQYGIHIRVHILPALGDADANRIRPRELDAFYASLRWKPAKESHNILRQAFDWALRNELFTRESNPLAFVRPSRRACIDHDGSYDTDDRIRPVGGKDIPAPAEVEKLVLDAEVQELDAWWLYLNIAAASGARPGEICAL